MSNWELVNAYLMKLGELELDKEQLEKQKNIKIEEIKDNYEPEFVKINNEIKNYSDQIHKIVSGCPEFNKEHFKQLTFGIIKRKSTVKIHINSIKAAVNSLKFLKLNDYIVTNEEVDKEKIQNLDAETLKKCGISIKKELILTILPDYTKTTS